VLPFSVRGIFSVSSINSVALDPKRFSPIKLTTKIGNKYTLLKSHRNVKRSLSGHFSDLETFYLEGFSLGTAQARSFNKCFRKSIKPSTYK
jgi:hypothetical protein